MRSVKDEISLFLFGLFAFVVAVFPYNAVGLLPSLEDWHSRHQLLVSLGASLISVYGIHLVVSSANVRKFIYSMFIALFLIQNIHYYIDFQRDWYKQLSLIENYRASTIIKNYTTFLFDDKTQSLNANHRTYRFYEFAGQFKIAFGDEKRFGHLLQSYEGMDKISDFLNASYNVGEYVRKKPEYLITINYGTHPLDAFSIIKLWYQEIFRHDKFKNNIKNIIKLDYERIIY